MQTNDEKTEVEEQGSKEDPSFWDVFLFMVQRQPNETPGTSVVLWLNRLVFLPVLFVVACVLAYDFVIGFVMNW